MNKSIYRSVVFVLLLSILIFSYSCQQKKMISIPVTPSSLDSTLSSDLDETKKEQIAKEFPFITDHVLDPYQELREKGLSGKGRFYKDLNQDGVPELFLSFNSGSSSVNYAMYRITKKGYDFLGYIGFLYFQLLSTKHNGYFDIQTFNRSFTEEDRVYVGGLYKYSYDGIGYTRINRIDYIYNENKADSVFIPDQIDETLMLSSLWSPKDDDKYRWMIK